MRCFLLCALGTLILLTACSVVNCDGDAIESADDSQHLSGGDSGYEWNDDANNYDQPQDQQYGDDSGRKYVNEHVDVKNRLDVHTNVIKNKVYVHRQKHVKQPIVVKHITIHHHKEIFKHTHPYLNRIFVERKQNIIAPEEKTVVTHTEGKTYKNIVHKPVVHERVEHKRLPTIHEPVKNLGVIEVNGRSNDGYGFYPAAGSRYQREQAREAPQRNYESEYNDHLDQSAEYAAKPLPKAKKPLEITIITHKNDEVVKHVVHKPIIKNEYKTEHLPTIREPVRNIGVVDQGYEGEKRNQAYGGSSHYEENLNGRHNLTPKTVETAQKQKPVVKSPPVSSSMIERALHYL